jgi:hypothetical protein
MSLAAHRAAGGQPAVRTGRKMPRHIIQSVLCALQSRKEGWAEPPDF